MPSPVTFPLILQLNTGTTPGDLVFNNPDLDTVNGRTNGGSAKAGTKDAGPQGANRLLAAFNTATSPYVAIGRAIRFTFAAIATVAARRTVSLVSGPTTQPRLTSVTPNLPAKTVGRLQETPPGPAVAPARSPLVAVHDELARHEAAGAGAWFWALARRLRGSPRSRG